MGCKVAAQHTAAHTAAQTPWPLLQQPHHDSSPQEPGPQLTTLQHDGPRPVALHDLCHHGLEQGVEGWVVHPLAEGHVQAAQAPAAQSRLIYCACKGIAQGWSPQVLRRAVHAEAARCQAT